MLRKKEKKKKVTVIFENEFLKDAYLKLPGDDYLKKRIDFIVEKIKWNPNSGQAISKRLIPRQYREKGFNNAFWVELSKQGWRLIYSLDSLNENEVIATILEWFTNHKDYEKRFKY